MKEKIYIRRMMKHDITHEVSLTAYVFYEFFLGQELVRFQIDGEGLFYDVTFNNATDLRFGGDFKAICRKMDAKEGDYLLITHKKDNVFVISIQKAFEAVKSKYYPFFTGTRRHLIAFMEDSDLKQQYIR